MCVVFVCGVDVLVCVCVLYVCLLTSLTPRPQLEESPPPLPPRGLTKSPHLRSLSEYGFDAQDDATTESAAADIMAELGMQVRPSRLMGFLVFFFMHKLRSRFVS